MSNNVIVHGLCEAAKHKHVTTLRALLACEEARALIDGYVDKETGKMYIPLHHAVIAARPENVRLLIEAGARVDTVDEYGCCAFSCVGNGRDEEIASILLEAGADPMRVNGNGVPIIDYLVDNDAIYALLAIAKFGYVISQDALDKCLHRIMIDRWDDDYLEKMILIGATDSKLKGETLKWKYSALIAKMGGADAVKAKVEARRTRGSHTKSASKK